MPGSTLAVRDQPRVNPSGTSPTRTEKVRNAHTAAAHRRTLRPIHHGQCRRLPRSDQMSASEKADVEFCGAEDPGRPTTADQVAPGQQRLSNGPSGPCGK
jgi:hypothetical protein